MTKVQSKNAILFDIVNDAGPLRDGLVEAIGEGTTVEPGLISADDKTKLDGIAAGATANAADAALRDRTTHTGEQAISTITGLTDALAGKATSEQGAKADAAIPAAQKGAANGIATLDSSGKVPAIQLPSFVDDVLEYDEVAEFPTTGETAKIYIALDTGRQYRWSGSSYAQIIASPGTTDDITEGASKLFFTAGRVRDVLLAGLSSASSAAIAASDSVLSAFGKLQAQINGLTSSKLNASAYTAADVLNKVKTVDGSGSGLDADTIQGQAPSAFATAVQGTKADSALQPAAIGVSVQAYDADLSAIGALAKTDGSFVVGNGSTWVAESGATARASLGLGTAAVAATADFSTAAQGTKADSALQPGSFGLGATGTVAVLADLDDPAIPSGLHAVSGSTAGTFPEGVYTGTVLVERYSGSWCKQTLTYRADSGSGTLGSRTYIRTYKASTAQWVPWKKVQYNDDPLSLGTFSTDLTSGQQSQVTTRPAVFTDAKAKIVLSSSYSGSDIQPAVHVTTKIDDDSGASAAAKVAGIYSYMEQTGSSTNQYPKAIAGVA